MKDMKNVFDFQDWIHALRNDGNVVLLEGNDCIKFPMGLSKGKVASKRPLIENITQVMFKKGSTLLYWNEHFYECYRSVEFLQKVLKMLSIKQWHPFE